MFVIFVIGSVIGFGLGYGVVKEQFVGNKMINNNRIKENNNIVFVDQEQFEKTVKKCPYFNLLTPWDLRVRKENSSNIHSYKNKYMKSRVEITSEQTAELVSLVKTVDNDLKMGSSVLGRIPWKFVIYDGTVENGLCHTIGDIIMFPNEFFEYSLERKLKLLIHEKVHVYQRYEPSWASDIIQKWNMTAIGRSDNGSLGWMEDIRRHNPDLDSYDYGFIHDDRGRIVELYTGDSSLSDSATFFVKDGETPILIDDPKDVNMPGYIGQIEHPYEMMACMIPVLVMNKPVELSNVENILWDALWI
jgi:hypothetical protein